MLLGTAAHLSLLFEHPVSYHCCRQYTEHVNGTADRVYVCVTQDRVAARWGVGRLIALIVLHTLHSAMKHFNWMRKRIRKFRADLLVELHQKKINTVKLIG